MGQIVSNINIEQATNYNSSQTFYVIYCNAVHAYLY